jgi:hypothetical protein
MLMTIRITVTAVGYVNGVGSRRSDSTSIGFRWRHFLPHLAPAAPRAR